MTWLIVRTIQWSDGLPDIMVFQETRKVEDFANVDPLIEDYKNSKLGYEGAPAFVTPPHIVCKISQAVYEILSHGALEYCNHVIHELPPQRKVKVINNLEKPEATWLSILDMPEQGEHPLLFPDQEEPVNF